MNTAIMEKIKEIYVNREISWLSFNERVLQEAADATTPLIERIKFLGIFSSNLDEFFRVRVATLTRMVKARKKATALLGEDPKTILNQIQKTVIAQQNKFNEFYQDILGELGKEGIFIVDETGLSPDQEEFVKSFFTRKVRQNLFPLMIDDMAELKDLKDNSIYLAVRMKKNRKSKTMRHALIEVPSDVLSRFLVLPEKDGKTYIIILDDVIRFSIPEIFAMFNCNVYSAYTIKITRDAELDIEDDITKSFFEKMSKSLYQRKRGAPVRFIYDRTMPQDFLKMLAKKNRLTASDTLIPGERYHNFKDFMDFPAVGSTKLRYTPFPPLKHPDIDFNSSLYPVIREKDILLHYPYQTFHHLIDLLREASIDPKVVSIKVTLYRVAKNSSVVNSLINAARNGKSVVVVLELQARFDEEANIYWTKRLREEGVKIIHGVPDLKVHCKLCLITRKEKKNLVHYASVGTGNFNESTATVYSDHSLFTADTRITCEINRIFDFFDHNYKTSRYQHLLVAPFYLRKRLVKFINNEISNARKEKEAYIVLKVNSIMDKEMIDILYRASQEGVDVRLIVRGICSLVPGVPGLSDNISAVSIVDRFLEHSRIFVFCNGGDVKYYISSADWMTRNLDRRVEVACPIYDERLQKQIGDFLDIQFRDNTKARVLNISQDNQYRKTDGPPVRTQFEFYRYIQELGAERKRGGKDD